MKLLTKEIEQKLVAARAQPPASEPDAQPIVVKFFTPDAQCTWFIFDGEPVGDDWEMFGLCDLGMGCPELGYVSLNELKSVRGKLGLPVERDLHYTGTLADARRAVGA